MGAVVTRGLVSGAIVFDKIVSGALATNAIVSGANLVMACLVLKHIAHSLEEDCTCHVPLPLI